MPRERRLRWSRVIAAAFLLAVIGVVVAVVARGRSLPDQPQEVAWNHQACAHCRMAVGEPAHAAQLVTTSGDVHFFDDPGCLLRYLDERRPDVHRMWFHEHAGSRWLAADEVGFLTGASTPMAFGLAATDRGAPGAIDLDAARAWVRSGRAGTVSDAGHGSDAHVHGDSP